MLAIKMFKIEAV